MKKVVAIVIFILIFTLSLCGCSTNNTALDFSATSIDNSFNNYIAGANLAFDGESLYCVCISGDIINLGTFRVNENGVKNLLIDAQVSDDAFKAPKLYQYNNALYSVHWENHHILKYNEDKMCFEESEFDFEVYMDRVYLSDNLIVYYAADRSLKVRYADNDEFTISENAVSFYVSDNILYFIDNRGWLYKNDVTKCYGNSEFISYLNESTPQNVFTVCGDYIYFDYSGNELSEYKSGLYCYCISEDKVTYLSDKEVLSANSYNDVLYYTDSSGLYSVTKDSKPSKVSNKSSDEVYILDESWIYLYNKNGKIYRVTFDGSVCERVKV